MGGAGGPEPGSVLNDVARVRVYVSGRVQGVFFRVRTREEAKRRGVTGTVRNLADGRVEAVFQGRSADVAACVAWCRTGPPGARVGGIEAADERPRPDETDFHILS